jgi:IclR family KDG regulon transcriptional repressor
MSTDTRLGAASAAVKSADRVFAVLDLLADRGPIRFSEIATALELPNSSAHNLLRTMTGRGYLEFDPDSHTYALGLRLWQVAQAYPGSRDLVSIAQPLMDRLVGVTSETVQLARLDGVENVYLAIAESPHPMKLVSTVGGRLLAHGTALGKALLASLDPADAKRRLGGAPLLRFTPNTITDLDQLLAELDRVRERGYALDNEEYVIGCRCVAMPVSAASGSVIAAMSISIPTPRYSEAVARAARAALLRTVADLERRLGYVDGNASAARG